MGFSIRKKLLGGFGVVLALLVAAVALSLSTMSGLNGHASVLGGRDMRAVSAIGTIRSDTFGVRAADGDNVHAPNQAVKQQTAAAVVRSRAAVMAALQVYSHNTDGPADAKAFASVRRYVLEILAGSDKALAFSAKGQMQQAIAAYAAAQPAMLPFDTGTAALAAARVKTASHDVASASSSYSSARTTLLVVGMVSLLIGLGLAVLLSERLSRGIRELARAADGIAAGDVEQTVAIKSRDELGETASAFARMIDYVKSMAHTADQIADGDLSVEVVPRGERDLLGNAFRRLVEKLGQAIGRVSAQASSVTAASAQMASTSEESGRASNEIARAVGDVAQGSERQVQLVEAARQSAEQVARAVAESAESARATAEVANEARHVAQEGVSAADQATEAMQAVRDSSSAVTDAIRELATKSEQIGAIVQTITGIAEQTNLLALNAAIEAARAGEQGRGFAVVAEEVRKLAEGSQHAAEEISGLIDAIQHETSNAVVVVESGAQRTQEGATVVEQTRAAFQRIDSAVEDMTARIEQVAAVSQQIAASADAMQRSIAEVAAVAEESSASTEQVSASTEETTASAEQIAASASELAGNAEELNRLVAQFKLTN